MYTKVKNKTFLGKMFGSKKYISYLCNVNKKDTIMINEIFYSHDLKCSVKRISKRTARRLWDDGKEIYFHSSNMSFDNMWQRPMPACKNGYSFVGYTFDLVCSDYKYYNCDKERGKYIHFFVKAE